MNNYDYIAMLRSDILNKRYSEILNFGENLFESITPCPS